MNVLNLYVEDLKLICLKIQFECDGFYYNIYQGNYNGLDAVFYVCSSKKLSKDIDITYHTVTVIESFNDFIEIFTDSEKNSVSRITDTDVLYTNGKDLLYYSNVNVANDKPGEYHFKVNTGTLRCPEKETLVYDFNIEPVVSFKINFAMLHIFKLKTNMRVI
jgi:hypothetical protein